MATTGPYISPVSGVFEANASNLFGASRSGGGRKHAGADWHAATGSPLVAAIGGRVVYVGYDGNSGGYKHFVDVLGSDGNVIRYAPHKAVTVKVGQDVAQGQQIGVIGPASLAGVPHLHMEVIPAGTPAFNASIKGQFGSTARVRGYISTVDPAQFFGLQPGVQVAAGQPFDASTAVALAGPHRQNVTPEAQATYALLTNGDPAHGVAPLPPQVAAGVVGNMMQEAYADLRPNAKGLGGEIGIGQWMPDRYANMVAWTKANGLDPNSREGQALFYSHELQGSPAMAQLANVKTPAEAAQVIATSFERAGNPMMDRRIAYAGDIAGASSQDAAAAMASGQAPAVPTTIADITAPPAVPAGPGSGVIAASMAGDPEHLTRAWNDLVTSAVAGGAAAGNKVSQYFAGLNQPMKVASAAPFAFNPDLWNAVPKTALPFGLGPEIRAPMQKAAEDILTGGHAAEQMKSLGIGPAAGPARFPSSDDMATLGLTPQERNLYQHHLDNLSNGKAVINPDGSTSTIFQMGVTRDGRDYNIPTVWDGKILNSHDAMQKALGEGRGWDYWPSYPASDTTNARMGSFNEAEHRYGQMHDAMEKDVEPQGDPLEVTKDPLQKINYQGGPMVGASMATTPPVTPPALSESMSYAMGGTPDVTFPLHLDAPAVVQPAADVPPPVAAPPPKKVAPSMVTQPPKYVSGEGRLGRLYNAIAAPIRPGSSSFWDGPMTQPFFTPGGGGATMPYQRNVTDASGNQRTQPDQYGNKVNVGVYTDNNGNQHQYTWSPSGAP